MLSLSPFTVFTVFAVNMNRGSRLSRFGPETELPGIGIPANSILPARDRRHRRTHFEDKRPYLSERQL